MGLDPDDKPGGGRVGTREVFRQLRPYLKAHRGAVIRSLILLAGVVAAALGGPQILRAVVNAATRDGSEPRVLVLAGFFIAIALIGFGLRYWMSIVIARAGLEFITELRARLFGHVLRLPAAFFHEFPPGRLMSRVESDTEALKQLFSAAAINMMQSTCVFLGVIAVMLWEDWRATGLVLLSVPLIFGLTALAVRILRKHYRASRRWTAQISAFIAEMVPSVALIQHYSYEDRAREKLEELNGRLVTTNRRAWVISYTFWGLFHLMEILSVMALIAVGAPRVIRGAMDLGTLIMFVEYLRQVFQPMIRLSEFVNFVQRALVSTERVLSLLALAPDAPRDPISTAEADPIPFERSLRFEQVHFSYKAGRPVLHGIDFAIEKGQKVALVGPSGGGKSTIAQLLLGFYTPSSGRVLVDDRDLDRVPRAAWRAKIGLVLQDLHLFPGTLRENLSVFGQVEDEALWRALRLVEAEALVERLGGLDASIAERGANLSQGERQLLSFARALAHDPPLLILDEATASVDPITEREIQRGMERLLAGRTALIIAHRLSTIAGADRILVVMEGQVLASGSHEELYRSEGLYRRLYDLQFQVEETGGRR